MFPVHRFEKKGHDFFFLFLSGMELMAHMKLSINWQAYQDAVANTRTIQLEGKVAEVVGLIAEGEGLGVSIGSLCRIRNDHGEKILAEAVGFRGSRVLLMPYGDTRGIRAGSRITLLDDQPKAEVGDALLGRVVDGMGRPLDNKGPVGASERYPLYGKPINPMQRRSITDKMDVGIGAINAMIPLGRGQRVAIMAGSGVGKSVLMGMMTKHTAAEVIVIGLIGERGREVKDFVHDTLGPEGLQKAVVVAATSDSPPLVRMRGTYLATTIAEYFRDQGKDVLLMIDSIPVLRCLREMWGWPQANRPPAGDIPLLFSYRFRYCWNGPVR
jgi:flagellum-specific ATP synthase